MIRDLVYEFKQSFIVKNVFFLLSMSPVGTSISFEVRTFSILLCSLLIQLNNRDCAVNSVLTGGIVQQSNGMCVELHILLF